VIILSDFHGISIYHTVVVGAHSLIDHKAKGFKKVQIDRIILHDRYEKLDFQNDVALLHLKNDLVFDNYVRPICLQVDDAPAGIEYIVAGWGETESKPMNV